MKTDLLVRACRENPALLRDIEAFLDEIYDERIKLCSTEKEMAEIYRNQGSARIIPVIKLRLQKLIRRTPS